MLRGLREGRLPFLRLRLERPGLFVVGTGNQESRLEEQAAQFVLLLFQAGHQPCGPRLLGRLLRLRCRLAGVFSRILLGVGLVAPRLTTQLLQRRIHLSQEFEHRVFGVGHGIDRGILLANRPLQDLDRRIEEGQGLCPQLFCVLARPLRVLDLCPTTFDEQVALLQIGLNRPLAFGALLQERLDLASCTVIYLSPPDGVGLRAVHGHERCRPPERHFLLEIGRGLWVLLHTVEHPEHNIWHLPLFERVEQPGRGDVLRGALRRIGGDSTCGGHSTDHPPSQQDKPQTPKRRDHDGASAG